MSASTVGIIHEEEGVFGISFPDFPGAISTGESIEDVVRKGAQMLAHHLNGMAEYKEELPSLRSFDQICADEPEWVEDGVAVAVPVETGPR